MGEAVKKGCLTLLAVLMVGFGSCVGLIVVTNIIDKNNDKKDIELAKTLQHKFEKKETTPEEQVLYAKMLNVYEINKAIAHHATQLELLQNAHQRKSTLGTVSLAKYFFRQIEIKRSDTKEELAKNNQQLNMAMNLIAEALEKSCTVDRFSPSLRYGDFYNAVLEKANLVESSELYRMRWHNDKLPSITNRANVIFLREYILCPSEGTNYYRNYYPRKEVRNLALFELTGKTNYIKDDLKATEEDRQKAQQLVKSYKKYYPN